MSGLLAVGASAPASAHGASEHHWEKRAVCVTVGRNVDRKWQARRVVRAWNRRQDAVHMRIRRSCAGHEQALRIQQYWKREDRGGVVEWRRWDNYHLKRGVIRLNRWSYQDSSSCRMKSLVAHEVAHALGADHVVTSGRATLLGVDLSGRYNYNLNRCGRIGRADVQAVRELYRDRALAQFPIG